MSLGVSQGVGVGSVDNFGFLAGVMPSSLSITEMKSGNRPSEFGIRLVVKQKVSV